MKPKNCILTIVLSWIVLSSGMLSGMTETETDQEITFRYLTRDQDRARQVGAALDFNNWPQTDELRVAPSFDRSMLKKSTIITQESKGYHLDGFAHEVTGYCRWNLRSPEGKDSISFRIYVLPNSRAAHEYLLSIMTENTMMTEGVIGTYRMAERPAGLGHISFVNKFPTSTRIAYVRDNIAIYVTAIGELADEALPLVQALDKAIKEQPALTREQFLARRPVVSIAPEVQRQAVSRSSERRSIAYDVTVPEGRTVARVFAYINENSAGLSDGRRIDVMEYNKGSAAVSLYAITEELLVGKAEQQIDLDAGQVKPDDPNDITNVLRGECNDLSSVLPDAFAAYRQQTTGNYTLQDCNALFVLVEKAKVMRDEPLDDATAKEARNRAYCAAWRIALHTRQHSNDPAVQKRILDEWNKALRQDDMAVPYQIYAMADRSLLTDDFWDLLKRTTRNKTISSIACMVYGIGTLADIEPLEQKRRSGIDVESQQAILNAISWLKYRLSDRPRDDNTRSGMPAARPPFRDMKEEPINQVEKPTDQEHLPQVIALPRGSDR